MRPSRNTSILPAEGIEARTGAPHSRAKSSPAFRQRGPNYKDTPDSG